jgi:hypothetical protein
MNIRRRLALRLALYLSCVQIIPQLSGQSHRDDEATLTRPFQNLSIEMRREARRTGRRLIRFDGQTSALASRVVDLSGVNSQR